MSQSCCGNNEHTESAHSGSEKSALRKMLIRFCFSAGFFLAGILVPRLISVEIDAVWKQIVWQRLPLLLFALSWAFAGKEVALTAVKKIFAGKKSNFFDENFLMTLATIGAFAIGEYAEGAAVMLFYNIGELLQEYAVTRSRRSISDLIDIAPERASVLRAGVETVVNPREVAAGDILVVRPGEKVPLDGTVIEGESVFDTAALTGESMPRPAFAGVQALSGFINGSGLLRVRVEKIYGESTASKILSLIENAENRKASAEKFITTFARVYTPIVVFAALIIAFAGPVTSIITDVRAGVEFSAAYSLADFSGWIRKALVFLVASCPCALVISIPLGFFGGIGGAAKNGILVKGANYLETLRRLKVVFFDKTGTLTQGSFKVVKVAVSPEFAARGKAENQLLEYAAAAEQYSNHPIARAITTAYTGEAPAVEQDSYVDRAGFGITAVIRGETVLVGNTRHLYEAGIGKIPVEREGTAVYVAVNGEYAGAIVLGDVLKPDAREVVSSLRKMGVRRLVMLTGDTAASAAGVAREAGLDEYFSDLLPQHKVERFETIAKAEKKINRRGAVGFVGDGVNDAPVLALADVGIAMGALGSDAAVEAADVVLMNDDLRSVSDAVLIARTTLRIVKQNIVFAFAVKAAVLVFGFFGSATLWEAVFADVGVALIAAANAARILRKVRK